MRTLKGSIRNIRTKEIFEAEIKTFRLQDIKRFKKEDWQFNWEKEFADKCKTVVKLTTTGDPELIHGLLSIGDNADHIIMYLIESAAFNKGKTKLYEGIPGNLVAYACKWSFRLGYEGYVLFYAKSRLIRHYEETLGARSIGGLKMILDTNAAMRLITKFLKTD